MTSRSTPYGRGGGALHARVAVLTYQRQGLLADLLPQLVTQVEELCAWTGGTGDVLVVDNDPEGSARDVCAAVPEVCYVLERTPGIAAGRQRALEESADVDVLQFIDDDEEPATGWLLAMVATWWQQGRPDVVAGRILPRFAAPPSPWVASGRFFDRRDLATGTPVDVAGTNNMLIDIDRVRRLGVGFDPSLGLHGGEDTLFSAQLVRAGGRIVFCREGAVHDLVPAERSTRSWVLQRAWYHGQTRSLVATHLARTGRQRGWLRLTLLISGSGRLVLGAAQSCLGLLLRDDRTHARGLWMVHRARGVMSGALRAGPAEYGRPGR
ncbi:glycosyltransferase [Nocardioides sp. HDW12B]|uniref:glycosyltransferase family 2 protein n=1 Tax=Nocardioides sp. HDW12B TaxID=2714939 RepID=UPI0014094733|nr:glycosyltransferase [Nocardioides sp. HDW12B]QIK65374.1 glycosyltransferase [Nocardioides sp. HDW12B]